MCGQIVDQSVHEGALERGGVVMIDWCRTVVFSAPPESDHVCPSGTYLGWFSLSEEIFIST